ncbi:MAG: hypothetical protein MJ094_03565 [Saccharofermentans sp.]|nr:hypothetical protein [Saccharofermentans sp.]
MIIREEGWRAAYRNFILVPLNKALISLIDGFPGKGDYVLTYGYIDNETTLRLEVVALAQSSEDGFKFFDTNDNIRSHINPSEFLDLDVIYVPDDKSKLRMRYDAKIDMLYELYETDELYILRGLGILDESRYLSSPDIVDVLLSSETTNNVYERVLVKTVGINEDKKLIKGVIAKEPEQNLGLHLYDEIEFIVEKLDSGRIVCVYKGD